ncbi:MAG TPA: MJ0042-type zinc finger domain-containing protein [Gemmataceae bacterium]|nr:MJ0042-type zinc finger domain-containing protein [Gemmataceae bacterium]
MSVDARCPACHAACDVTDDDVGKKVRCDKCEQVFVVKEKTRNLDDDEDDSPWMQDADVARRKGHGQQTGEAGKRSRKDDADEADRDDSPDEQPRRKSRPADEDDDPPPRRGRSLAKPKSGRLGLILGLAGGAAVLVLLLACGVGAWFAWGRFGDNPAVTPANFERIQLNAPLADVHAIFGPGREWTGGGVKSLLDDPRLKLGNAHVKAVAANPQGFGITHWYRWSNGPSTMFVGLDGGGKVRVAGLVSISSHQTSSNFKMSV